MSFVWIKIKKQKNILKFLWSLPKALTIALGKEIPKTNKKIGLCRGLWSRPSAKNFSEKIKKNFAEGQPGSPRQRN